MTVPRAYEEGMAVLERKRLLVVVVLAALDVAKLEETGFPPFATTAMAVLLKRGGVCVCMCDYVGCVLCVCWVCVCNMCLSVCICANTCVSQEAESNISRSYRI